MVEIIEKLQRSKSSKLCPSANPAVIAKLDKELTFLPKMHTDMLKAANGLSVYHGYLRLFGLGCKDCTDILWWNDPETWKFAWNLDLSKYLCFAEDGWGYQWAYNLDDLRNKGTSKIYRLAAYIMKIRELEDSFEGFVKNELIRWLTDPYFEDTVKACQKYGALDWNTHIAYTPSLILGGVDGDIEHTMKLPSQTNMIFNGDAFVQAGKERVDRKLKGIETYKDQKSRPRLRVLFEK